MHYEPLFGSVAFASRTYNVEGFSICTTDLCNVNIFLSCFNDGSLTDLVADSV